MIRKAVWFLWLNRVVVIYMAVLIVLPLVFTTVMAGVAVRHSALIHSFTTGQWALVYAVSCLTMAFALTPTTVVALASGFFLGWTSVPAVVVSYVGAALLGYAVATFADRGRLIQSIEGIRNAGPAIERLRTGEGMFVVAARLSPFLPFAMMNVLLSALRVNIRTFLVASVAGMLPRTLVFIWIGTQFAEISTAFAEGTRSDVAQISVVVLSVLSVLGLLAFAKHIADGILSRDS